jgi:ribosomal protein L11 methyltransferase
MPEPITYHLSIDVPASSAERIASVLEEADRPSAQAVGLFDRGDGRFEVFAHYQSPPDGDNLRALIARAAGSESIGPMRVAEIAETDWVTLSQGRRKPVSAGRFLIHGSHDRARTPRRLLAIEIDAARAFGTAHHQSTRGSLLALDDALKRGRFECMIDIGTGTGILAIAAAKALRRPVLASDSDSVAVAIAAENARKAGVSPLVHVLRAQGFAHQTLRAVQADLILANLLDGTLRDLAPAFARRLRIGGTAILSGITQEQARALEARYRANGFDLKKRILLGGWATLVLTRRSTKALRD